MEANLHEVKNLCPLYPLGKRPWYPLDGRMPCPYRGFGRCGKKNNILLLQGIEPSFPASLSSTLVCVSDKMYQLSHIRWRGYEEITTLLGT
jgi:hypothetical protein